MYVLVSPWSVYMSIHVSMWFISSQFISTYSMCMCQLMGGRENGRVNTKLKHLVIEEKRE